MLRPWIFVGFTGHRTLAKPELIQPQLVQAVDRIAVHSGGPLAAVSSAAKGADTLFAELCRDRNLPWVLLLPFAEEEFFNEHDFEPADLERIRPLVERAVLRHIEPGGTEGTTDHEQRANAFADCSARTVDESDYLIAVWDGQHGSTGGTGGTVAYARAQAKPIIWINSLTGAITEENFAASATADTASTPSLVRDTATGGLPAVSATQRYHDELAVKRGPESQTIVRDVIFWHLGATFAGLFEPVLGLAAWAAALFKSFKLVVLLYARKRAHAQHHIKHEWLRSRIIAELCRSAIATWPLTCAAKTRAPVTVPGFRDWQRSLILWRHLAPPGELSLPAQRDAYLANRLESKETGQIPYFEKEYAEALRRQRKWQRIATWSTNIAIACAAAGLLILVGYKIAPDNPVIHSLKSVKPYVTLAALCLPLLSSAAFTLLMASDCNRRVERNREMLAHLKQCRDRIRAAKTRSALERHVTETESMLILEVLEWHSVTHFTASAH